MEDRPPYIECFIDAVEDREATIREGHYVGKDVVFFRVIPAGGKLEVVQNAEEHLRNLRKRGDKMFPAYEGVFKAFQEGSEPPANGTPVKDWPAISPAEVKLLLSINVRSVEDLATLPEEGMQRLGMGARALQRKALTWLESANSTGKTAERLAALEARAADQADEMKRKDDEIAELRAKLEAKEGPREKLSARGSRAAKEDAA